MNQILFTGKNQNILKVYKFVLYFSIIIICISCFFITFFVIQRQNKKYISNRISNNYETLKLYANSHNFDNFKNIDDSMEISDPNNVDKNNINNTNNTNSANNLATNSENINYIIGNINIPTLDLNLPFFSFLDDSYLAIAPCRFFGDMPPSYGNLCIAGHNYDNDEFFSNLYKLKKDDQIIIYDNLDHQYLYKVYDIFEVKENDLSPVYNFDNTKQTLTLFTCNNLNNNRLIVKSALCY